MGCTEIVFIVVHFNYLLSNKDLRTISKQTGAANVMLGTPKSEPPRPWMDHCTVVFNSDKTLVKNKQKLSEYAYKAKPTNVDLWTKPQFVNCCSLCGRNRASDYCKCKSIKSAGPIVSGEAHLNGKSDPAVPSEWNPWASADHAEFAEFQKRCQKNPPEDATFEEPNVKDQNVSVGAADLTSATGASSAPGKMRSVPQEQLSNKKPFFQSLQEKGLEILDIPEKLLSPFLTSLQRSKAGWTNTGKSQYAEKILGSKNLFGGKMAISYDSNKKLRHAQNWNVKFEALAREASKIASSPNCKVDVNLFIVNRYDSDDQTGGVHADTEPQCNPKYSVVIPIGAREFSFMSSKDPSSPGYQHTTLTLDTGQMLIIPPELNEGPNQVFHAKGKGLSGGQHYTLVGKHYVGLQKSH